MAEPAQPLAETLVCVDCGRKWIGPVEDVAPLVHQRVRRGRIPAGAVKHSGRSLLIDRVALDRAIDR